MHNLCNNDLNILVIDFFLLCSFWETRDDLSSDADPGAFFLHGVVFMAQVNIFLHKNQIEASILGIRSLLHGIEYVAYKI